MKVGLGKYHKKIRNKDIKLSLYTKILDDTIEALTDKVVQDNDKLSMGGIGTLQIHAEKNKFKRKYIDSASSLKRRKQIIEEGGTPLKCEKDENGKVIGDNGGEPWLMYIAKDVLVMWTVNNNATKRIAGRLFKFHATRGNKRKLAKHATENPLKENLYGIS